MLIANLCNKNIVYVSKTDNVQTAAKLMKEKSVGSIVIVNNKETDLRPYGILTDRDLVIHLMADDVDTTKLTVEDVIDQHLLVINKNQDIKDAIDAMASAGVRRAPIVDEQGKIAGIISTDDLFTFLASEFSQLSQVVQKQMPSQH